MKTYLLAVLLILPLYSFSNTSKGSGFILDDNGITCLCPEAAIGESGTLVINGVQRTFTKRTRAQITPENAASTCTSGITDMSGLFDGQPNFNADIRSWDVSSVTNMAVMFRGTPFNQPIGGWDVSNVRNMHRMFEASSFNQNIGDWDVSKVTDMAHCLLPGTSQRFAKVKEPNLSYTQQFYLYRKN